MSGFQCETANLAVRRLVLADDHQDVLAATQELLVGEFEIVGLAMNGERLVATATETRPDLVVTDIQMPHLSGIEAGRRLIEAGVCNAIVLLTMHNEAEFVQQALDFGIRGYVLKTDADELIPALRKVESGERYLSRGVRGRN